MRSLFAVLTGILTLAFLLTCVIDEPIYYQHHYQNQFEGQYHYDVNPRETTTDGIRVDTSGLDFAASLFGIDEQTKQVEKCLINHFGMPAVIPPDQVKLLECDSNTFPLPIIRKDLVVKIATNWIPSCDGSEQLLPVPAPWAGCEAKGMYPTADCPGCYWRAGIEDNRYIVVTPNLFLMKDPLIRMVTGCNSVWVGDLAECALP